MPEMLDEPLGGAARAFSLTPNDDYSRDYLRVSRTQRDIRRLLIIHSAISTRELTDRVYARRTNFWHEAAN
jgi:hypothetical protein